MNNPKALNQRMDLAQQFETFTGLKKPNDLDRFFLIVGAPGSGKTSFITRCTEKEPFPTKGLPKCTDIIRISNYKLNNRHIYLIDTPGFSDPRYSDTQTLQVLASYLAASYANGVRIHGVLMLQSLAEPKVPSSIVHNLRMVMAMCGFNWYRHFGICITRPYDVDDHKTPCMSEKVLLDTYFANLMETDAFVKRYNLSGSRDAAEQTGSARDVIAHMISLSDSYPAEIMRIQREVFRERRVLGQTVVGSYIGGELRISERSYRAHARIIAADWVRSLEEGRFEEAAELKLVKGDLERYLNDVLEDLRILGMSIEDFHDEGKRVFGRSVDCLERDFFDYLQKRQREIRGWEEALDRRFTRGTRYRSLAEREETAAIVAEYKDGIREIKEDLKQAQNIYKEFNEQTDRARGQIGLFGNGLVCSVM